MRREAKLLMMLDHPGIVECYDVIDDGQQMVIVMVRTRPALLPATVCVAQSVLSGLLPVAVASTRRPGSLQEPVTSM